MGKITLDLTQSSWGDFEYFIYLHIYMHAGPTLSESWGVTEIIQLSIISVIPYFRR